jgi:hypothetical protein
MRTAQLALLKQP